MSHSGVTFFMLRYVRKASKPKIKKSGKDMYMFKSCDRSSVHPRVVFIHAKIIKLMQLQKTVQLRSKLMMEYKSTNFLPLSML